MTALENVAISYGESRTRFVRAVQDCGGRIVSYGHPTARGPHGEDLYVDVGVLGPEFAPKAFACLTGVHGVEGPPGSAILVDALTSGQLSRLPVETKAVLVHAINPWGMAHGSRTTQSNVDLNRNFLDFSVSPPSNPVYRTLHSELCSADLRLAFEALQSNLRWCSDRGDLHSPVDAILRGQYEYDDGIGFGGRRAEWSNQILRQIVADHLACTEVVAFIDWHTGIGEFAEAVPLCFHDRGSEPVKALRDWHGSDVTEFAGQFLGGVAPQFTGLLVKGLEEILSPRRLYAVVVEFGTKPNGDVIRALMIDRWLTYFGRQQPSFAVQMREEIAACFCPGDARWWNAVRPRARQIIVRTLDGLASL